MKRFAAALVLLPFLEACGGTTSTNPLLPATDTLGSVSKAQSDAQYGATREALSTSGSTDLLYVGNTGDNSITVYRHDASGNTAPQYVIAGSKTGIHSPGQLSEDAQGNLYVANGGSSLDTSSNPGVLVFAHGAHGNIAPIRKLAGSQTGLHTLQGLTVDKVTGKLFVVDASFLANGSGPILSLLRFPPNATGNLAPFARATIDGSGARQLASDSSGNNVINVNTGGCCKTYNDGIDTWPKQFANNAILSLVYWTRGFDANGVADDPTTKTYLATSGSAIYRFAERTTGYGFDGPIGYTAWTPPPVSVITSDICGGQLAVASGPTPYTYVMHSMLSACPANAVYVYANNASGNAKPVRILTGSATQMNQPYGIYEGNIMFAGPDTYVPDHGLSEKSGLLGYSAA